MDWGFGRIMPYSLDIARFIAHATEDKATFPFYMNDEQKKIFVNGVYERLEKKPDYQEYLRDIQLAVLNESVEFIEAGEDEDNWYKGHAIALAKKIIVVIKWSIILAKINKFMVLANICDFNETPCEPIETMV